MSAHWMTTWDPGTGELLGALCECGLGEDHTGAEYEAYMDMVETETARAHAEAEAHERHGDGGPI